jgi:hypothetical protein
MARTEMMTVSIRELHRLKTIQAVVDGLLPMRTAVITAGSRNVHPPAFCWSMSMMRPVE